MAINHIPPSVRLYCFGDNRRRDYEMLERTDYRTWVGSAAGLSSGDCVDQALAIVGGFGPGDGRPLSAEDLTDWDTVHDRTGAIPEPVHLRGDVRSIVAKVVKPIEDGLERQQAAERRAGT